MSNRIVVEWTRGSVRLAVAEGAGSRWKLRRVHARPVPPGGDVAATIQALMALAGSPAADEVIGVLPREQIITRLVRFPSTDPAELSEMAELYAKGQLPYTKGQAVVDTRTLQQEQGFSTVGLVACQRDVVERHLSVLREAGLPSALVTVTSWGVMGWSRTITPQPEQPVLIVNIDDTRTDFTLVSGQRLLASRSVAQGAQEWQHLAETAELLATEVERTRTTLRKELPGIDVKSLLLTGLGALAQWQETVAQRVSVPVTVIEASKAIDQAVEGAAISPVAIAGVAVSEQHDLVNLSPSEARAQVHHRRELRKLKTATSLVMAAVILAAASLGAGLWRAQRMNAQLEQLVKTLEPKAKRVREQGRSIDVVRALFEDRRRFAATLSGIFQSTPEPVSLEALTVEQSRREITVRGLATSTQTVLDYIQSLEQLEGIEAVELKYSTSRTTPSGERTHFELLLKTGSNAAS